jgi:hypothetical protein
MFANQWRVIAAEAATQPTTLDTVYCLNVSSQMSAAGLLYMK